jgi:hypothetical protein
MRDDTTPRTAAPIDCASRRRAHLRLAREIARQPIGMCPSLFLECFSMLHPLEADGLIAAKLHLCEAYQSTGGVMPRDDSPRMEPESDPDDVAAALEEIRLQAELPDCQRFEFIPMPDEIRRLAREERAKRKKRKPQTPYEIPSVRVRSPNPPKKPSSSP